MGPTGTDSQTDKRTKSSNPFMEGRMISHFKQANNYDLDVLSVDSYKIS